MSKRDDFIFIFQTPNPEVFLAVKFWSNPDEGSEPVELEAKHVRGVVDVLQHKGYEAFGESNPNGVEGFLLVRKGYNPTTANKRATTFLRTVVTQMMIELGFGSEKLQ